MLADDDLQDDLQEMVSYRRNVTGIDHTLFISPRGHARHGLRVKVAIDPPDSLDPRGKVATVGETVVIGDIDTVLLVKVRWFMARNYDVLMDYWNYRIDTDELRQRLQAIEG